MPGTKDGSNGGQMYKPTLKFYVLAKENPNFKVLTMKYNVQGAYGSCQGPLQRGLLDVDSSLNVSRKEIYTRVKGFWLFFERLRLDHWENELFLSTPGLIPYAPGNFLKMSNRSEKSDLFHITLDANTSNSHRSLFAFFLKMNFCLFVPHYLWCMLM